MAKESAGPSNDLAAILSSDRRRGEMTEDDDVAFEIQMQEALAASLALRPPPSESDYTDDDDSDVVVFPENDSSDGESDQVNLRVAEALLRSDMERLELEREDHERCEAEMIKTAEDLSLRLHDRRVAGEIMDLPEEYWNDYGDLYEKPYDPAGRASSSSASGESMRLYFKGLVSEERVRDTKVAVAGAGIAICDPNNNLLFHGSKNLEVFNGGEMISGEMAELEALVKGLHEAFACCLPRIDFVCHDNTLYNYVTNGLQPGNAQIATLLGEVASLQRKFAYCGPSLATQNTTNVAFQFARKAIVSQIIWSAETDTGKRLKETCVICLEDTDVAEMFSIDGCLHRYCLSCMKRHVEVMLRNGKPAKCPHDGCNSEVAIDSCAKFLPPDLVEVMGERIKESVIPVDQRIYCPVPKCSALMSKADVLKHTLIYFADAELSTARKCMKCEKFFCLQCKVIWHYELTCHDYKAQNPHYHGDVQKLKSLATDQLWRQCAKCNHMVELLEGCYHITCRCGYEFCYTCGAEWKDKKATCECPIWDERNIIRDEHNQQ